MPYVPPSPYSVVYDGSLTEDYILTDDIIVSQSSVSPLGVFQDSAGNTEALVIVDGGVLMYVYADPSSPSGWNITQVSPVGMDVAEVVAGLHSDNMVYGFYTDSSGNLYYISLPQGGAWSSPAELQVNLANLRLTYNAESLVAYGPDSNGNLQIVSDNGSGFTVNQIANTAFPVEGYQGTFQWWRTPGPGVTPPCLLYNTSSSPGNVTIVAENGSYYDSVAWGPYDAPPTALGLYQGPTLDGVADTGGIMDGSWYWGYGLGSNTPALWVTVLESNLVIENLGLSVPALFTIAVFLDSQQNLAYFGTFAASDGNNPIAPGILVNGPFVQAAVILDSNGVAHVYLLDSNGTLSVVHQTTAVDGTTNISDISDAFLSPIPLLTGISRIAVAPNIQDVKSLFSVSSDIGALYFHQQTAITDDPGDPNSGAWTSVKIQQPGEATGYYVTQYLTELLILDAYGVPVPQAQVSIASDTPSTITVAGASSLISSTQPVSCTTDATGKIRLATIASSVGTTRLQVTCNGVTIPVSPDAAVQSYMQGATGLNDMPPLTADTLTAARTANGNPLCPAIQPGNPNAQTLAQQACTTIGTVYGAGKQFTAPLPSTTTSSSTLVADAKKPASQIVGFHLDWSDLTDPKLTPFYTEAEIQAHRALLGGSIFSHFSHFAGDIYHGLKHAVISVTQWTVHLGDSTIDFVTRELGTISAMVIRSIDDVIAVVHSVFNAIGAAVTDVIEFIKALFSWGDIWKTKEVLEHWMEQGIAFLEDLLNQYTPSPGNPNDPVSNFFNKLEGDIANQFSKLQKEFGNPTIGSRSSQSPVPAASGASSSPAPSARGNWMMDKLGGDSKNGLPSMSLKPGNPLETALNNLKTTFTNPPADADWYSSLESTCRDAGHAFLTLAANPSKIPSTGISDLIQILQDLVTTAIKAADWFLTIVLDLLSALVAAIDDILNTPLTKLPLVSWLYSHIIAPNGESLTLGHAMALMAAVPLTLLYKLTNSGKAPFTSAQVSQIQSQTFSPDSPTPALVARASDDASSSTTLVGDFLPIVLGVETLSYSFADLTAQAAAGGDEAAEIAARIAALFNATLSWTAQVLSWPGTPFTRIDFSSSSITEGERILDAMWVANWVPPAMSLGWVGVTWVNESFSKVLGATEKVEDIGNAIVTVIGSIREYMAMVGSIWQVVDNPGAPSIEAGIENVLAQVPDSLELLRLSSVVEATDGISVPIKIALNAICNMSVAGLQAAQTA